MGISTQILYFVGGRNAHVNKPTRQMFKNGTFLGRAMTDTAKIVEGVFGKLKLQTIHTKP